MGGAGFASMDAALRCYWTKRDGVWLQRRFDGFEALADDEPVVHVSWHEAQAYCAFAKRRLPSEAEWEFAAAHDGVSGVKRFLPWGARTGFFAACESGRQRPRARDGSRGR